MNYKIIQNLPIYDLDNELKYLIKNNFIKWNTINNQICLNHIYENSFDTDFGTGQLGYDWKNSKKEIIDGIEKIILPKIENPIKETDFKYLCNNFKFTLFEDIYEALNEKFKNKIGRIRIMKSKPISCLHWHKDDTIRLHYPIKTQEGCFMVIGDSYIHLAKNNWWLTNTIFPHTAVNSSLEDRIHLVVSIISEDFESIS